MIRIMRQGARWGALLVALGSWVVPVGLVHAAEPDEEELEGDELEGDEDVAPQDLVEQPTDEVAQVKLEIKLESGRVIKPEREFVVEYGVDNRLEIQAEGAMHQFLVNVRRKSKDDKGPVVSITFGYDLDGEPIVAPYVFDAKVKKREVLRIEGGVAIAFVITPKKVAGEAPTQEEEPEEPEEKPKKKKKKIEKCDPTDPLCGTE